MIDAGQRERLVAETLAPAATVDILVNNAGLGHTVPIEDETLDVFRQAMEVNVTAIWHLAKLCGEVMVAKGSGSIVNVASMLGLVGSTPVKQAHYTASKGAVDQPHRASWRCSGPARACGSTRCARAGSHRR